MLVLLYSTTSYGVMLNISNGTLLGASEVNVNGDLYDVAFKDGICADLYDGCDQNSDFPFANPLDIDDGTLGLAANIALIDQVFIDSSLGAFDSIPSLTNGCFAVGGCLIRTPLFLTQDGTGLGIQTAFNRNSVNRDIGTGSGGALRSFDSRIQDPRNDSHVYAVWSQNAIAPVPGPGPGPAPAPIPEPSTVLLFGSGLVGLFAMRKKLTKASALPTSNHGVNSGSPKHRTLSRTMLWATSDASP